MRPAIIASNMGAGAFGATSGPAVWTGAAGGAANLTTLGGLAEGFERLQQ